MTARRRALWASALIAAASVVSGRALAYCRALTESPPPDFDQTKACFAGPADGSAKPLYWSNACVGFSMQAGASRHVALDEATRVTRAAFAAWQSVDCPAGGHPSIEVDIDMGPVACDQVEYNAAQPNQHVIVFRDDAWPYVGAANTLGLTTLRPDRATGEIFDADIEINGGALATADGATGGAVAEFAAIITHEVGHYLGLAHSTRSDAVMYAYYRASPSGTTLALTDDDIAGVCAIYPPDGTRRLSDGALPAVACDPTPRHGFSSACSTPGNDAPDVAGVASSGCTVSVPSPVGPPSWSAHAVLVAFVACAARHRRRAKRALPRCVCAPM